MITIRMQQYLLTDKFRLSEDMPVILYRNANPEKLIPDDKGYYTIALEWGEGVFVTVG